VEKKTEKNYNLATKYTYYVDFVGMSKRGED